MLRGGVLAFGLKFNFSFIILPGLLLGLGCSNDPDKADHFSTDNLIQSEGKFYVIGEADPYTGAVINWFPNGQKKYETQMVDGIPQGPAVEWHENGQKKMEVTLENGNPVGTMNGWHANGARHFEMPLHEGKQHGLLVEYDTGNHRISTTRYMAGVREGDATGYDVTGKKSWETTYRNNLLEGDFIEYHPNGKRRTQSPYKQGVLRGVAKGWHPGGAQSWVAEWNGSTPLGTHQNWHPNGKLQRKQVFADGALTLYTEWHSNGQKTLEAKYLGNALVRQQRWDANGTLLLDEGGNTPPVAGLPPARRPDPPKPNPFSAGRRTVWVIGQLNRVYKDKDAGVVETAFGAPDEKQGDVWVYKKLSIVNTATRQRLTSAHFYISNGKVILVEEK